MTYDAYGKVVTDEQHAALGKPHAGHKALFFDRLDAGVVDPCTYTETPRLLQDAVGHYHVRNRVLSPKLGRWLQEDPNATGQTVVADRARNGSRITPNVIRLDLRCRFSDGAHLYQYVNSNSLSQQDVLGLDGDYGSLNATMSGMADVGSGMSEVGEVGAAAELGYAAEVAEGAEYMEVSGSAPSVFTGGGASGSFAGSALKRYLVYALIGAIAIGEGGQLNMTSRSSSGMGNARSRGPYWLPPVGNITVNMGHIGDSHVRGGCNVQPGSGKSLWPADWDLDRIEREVRSAYANGTRSGSP